MHPILPFPNDGKLKLSGELWGPVGKEEVLVVSGRPRHGSRHSSQTLRHVSLFDSKHKESCQSTGYVEQ
jgi:hypothetical protein